MSHSIRPAAAADHNAITAFTTDTFDWGDYVPERFLQWLDDPRAATLVATSDDDSPIGLVHVQMVSATEAWLQGARVHPEHRRTGVATALTAAGHEWIRKQGGLVGRLAVEEGNMAAAAQVEASGMRPVATFCRAWRPVAAHSLAREGNGGRRTKADVQLQPASAVESGPAFVSWASSEAARSVRGLFARRWVWRRLTEDDIGTAAAADSLWTAAENWIIAEETDDVLDVIWCDASPDRAADVARAVVDLAVERGAGDVRAMVPATPPLRDAFARAGFERRRIVVYAAGV